MIEVVNKKFYKGNAVQIYIGRPSILGNPFKDGTREENIAKFRVKLWLEVQKKTEIWKELLRIKAIAETQNIALVCWCVPKDCHGGVIKKCLEWITKGGDSK